MFASVTEVSVHIVNETSRCTTDNPKMQNCTDLYVCQLLISEGMSETTFNCDN